MSNLQNLEQSRLELREIQLFYKIALDKYRNDIPVELLKEMNLELKRLRERYTDVPAYAFESACK